VGVAQPLAVALQTMVIDPQFGFEVAALQMRVARAASSAAVFVPQPMAAVSELLAARYSSGGPLVGGEAFSGGGPASGGGTLSGEAPLSGGSPFPSDGNAL